MRKSIAKSPKAPPAAAKPSRQHAARPTTTNKQLTQQNRKILGKHYANRFGKR